MFGSSTELITKGELATVKRFDYKTFTRSYRKREQQTLLDFCNNDYG